MNLKIHTRQAQVMHIATKHKYITGRWLDEHKPGKKVFGNYVILKSIIVIIVIALMFYIIQNDLLGYQHMTCKK